ncbi:T-cell surface glycoprotein CD4 isoform X2 [Vombatus ursinus]|uniref:T-cell surface glycoprotein CD4 isoform X2 n=1 Tax=Vombatus ursinus TaxID=29139 RepID=UPI000FFD676A|nr:T-cell surface glycoprotein CD4 isoform X2 [Vombatus ursinus]
MVRMDRGATFAILLLALQLVLLPAMTRGKELILGEAGGIAELPCKASKKENMDFTWKQPDQLVLLKGFRKSSPSKMIGNTKKKDRVDSLTNQWDGGSFPLIIKKLEMADSGTYFCEVEARKQEIQLLVFKVTANPSDSVFSGTNVTLTLHGSSNVPALKVEWSGPGDESKRILSQDKKTLNLMQMETNQGGLWDCTVSVNGKALKLSIRVTVFGFTSSSQTFYLMKGKAAKFSFPLNLNEQDLNREQPNGELRWQVEGVASPPQSAKFSWKSGSLILENGAPNFNRDPKFPLTITLSPVLPQHAGSGVFLLKFSSGTLEQKVNLVVMTAVSQESRLLCCDVQGPIIPGLRLTWMLENQTEKSLEVSKEQRQLEVNEPKAGTWECQLLSQNQKILKSDSFKLTKQEWKLPFQLGIGLGAGATLLLLSGLSIFCCARRRHRLRRAERMSQIRRLLSEKKTCQCPHRF